MKLKTKDLQDLIPIIRSVVGNNELQPKTTMIGIKTTSDHIEFYAIGRDKLKLGLKVSNPDQGLDIAVNANLFLGLLDKTTTDEIELTLNTTTSNLEFKGNGNYNIPQQISETGTITFENINTANLSNTIGVLKNDFIKSIIDNNSFALLDVKESENQGRLSTGNYHIRTDKTITSDSNVISKTTMNSGLTKEISLSPTTIKSLWLSKEDLSVYEVGNDLIFSGGEVVISSPKVSDSDQFPFDALNEQLEDNLYKETVSVDKASILSTIDRLSLFNIDDSPIKIEFGANTVTFYIKKENESIVSSGNGNGFVFETDPIKFLDAVKAINNDTVTFKFDSSSTDILRLDGKELVEAISSR